MHNGFPEMHHALAAQMACKQARIQTLFSLGFSH